MPKDEPEDARQSHPARGDGMAGAAPAPAQAPTTGISGTDQPSSYERQEPMTPTKDEEALCELEDKKKAVFLASQFWRIEPKVLHAMGLTRQEYYAAQMADAFAEIRRDTCTRAEAAEARAIAAEEALKPFVEGYAHTAVFLSTREKMHPAGRDLYREDVERARQVLTEAQS